MPSRATAMIAAARPCDGGHARAGLNEPEEGTALEIYVSTDVETDGPIPGVYSMLSIGSAAYLPDKTLHGGFTVNLETLPGAAQHPDTMKWWKTQPDAWAACRQDVQSPETAMRRYLDWLKSLP